MLQTLGSSSEDVLAVKPRGGHGLTSRERQSVDLSARIKGWGSDLDPAARPGVPMDKAPGIGVETLYPPIERQVPRHKVHKSTEHGKMPPVFGNVCPPRGLSGKLRDFAYTFSEGRREHWLLLMLADRVDVVEQIFIDLGRLDVPNLPKEMGWPAKLKYDRKKVLTTGALVGGFGLLALVAASSARRSRTSA